jgi:hypothetical protein
MSEIDKLLHDLKTKRAHGAGNMITHMVMDEAYAEIIRLRAALDAQATGVAVKPLVWVDEHGDGVLTSRETGRLIRIFPQNGGGFCAPSLATDLFKTPEDVIAAYQDDHEAFVLRCVEPAAAPRADVAMRERAIGIIDTEIKNAFELGAQHHIPVLAAVRRNIEALPTTFTPAELLAAAMQLPEVKALVGAMKEAGDVIESYHKNTGIDLGDASRMPFYKDTMVKIDATLSPFTRKGE